MDFNPSTFPASRRILNRISNYKLLDSNSSLLINKKPKLHSYVKALALVLSKNKQIKKKIQEVKIRAKKL